MNDREGKFRASYDKYSSGSLYNSERNETLFPEKEEKPESETVKGIVCNARNVKVRATPKSDGNNVVTIVKEGTIVDILDKVPNFYQISLTDYPGRVLYISSSFCKEV